MAARIPTYRRHKAITDPSDIIKSGRLPPDPLSVDLERESQAVKLPAGAPKELIQGNSAADQMAQATDQTLQVFASNPLNIHAEVTARRTSRQIDGLLPDTIAANTVRPVKPVRWRSSRFF